MTMMRYMNAGAAMVRVWELEQQLSIPKSEPIFHLKAVNARVQELERKVRGLRQIDEAVVERAGGIVTITKPSLPRRG
jgi:hypothetical protein